MLANVSRPNFFPGQFIDYKDFNRLSEQADRVLSLLCRYLYSGGGVIEKALDNFEVIPVTGLSVLIKPGIALLPKGLPIVSNQELMVDLTSYLSSKKKRTLVVSLIHSVKGQDRYVDNRDNSITGYRSEAVEPEIVVGTKVAKEGVELFRVVLPPAAKALRLSLPNEEWETDLLDQEGTEGILDLRFRNRIVPQTFGPISTSETIALRKAFYQIEEGHRKLTKLFFFEDPYGSIRYLSQLHAEILSRPMQPVKTMFLVSEFSHKFSLFLEALVAKVGNQRTNFDRTSILDAIGILESMVSQEILPREMRLEKLLTVSEKIQDIVRFAEEKFSLLNSVEEALIDVRDRHLIREDKITLAGQLFQKIDVVRFDNKEKALLKSKQVHVRQLTTQFKNGDPLTLKGAFLKDGYVTLDLSVAQTDKPLVLLMHQYVRRSGSAIHYEINGKHLVTDRWEKAGARNLWINRGFVVPANVLAPQENRFKIRLDSCDLDFGIFDLVVYQPVTKKGARA